MGLHKADEKVGRASKLPILAATAFCAARAAFQVWAATTVGSGETLTVTDSNVADYADGISFADATGVVEFNTSSAPTMSITGAGTVKKTYSGDWTMSTQISGFTGDYVLSGGGIVTVSSGTRYYFGAESKTGGALVVKEGNTLYVPNTGSWAVMGNRPVHIAGTGYNSMGAVNTGYAYSTSGDFIKYLVLDGDATFYQNGPNYYNFIEGGEIDLAGHELTLSGNGSFQLRQSSRVSTNGVLRIVGRDSSHMQDLALRTRSNSYSIDSVRADSPFILDDNSRIHFYLDDQSRPKAVCRHLRVDGINAFLNVDGQSSLNARDWTHTNLLAWAGPIVLNETSAPLGLYSTYSEAQLTLSGPVSGIGSLKVTSKNNGRVYLANTNNSYSGYTYFDNVGSATHGNGSVLLASPGSVPNYSSLTTSYGFVSVRLKNRESDDEPLWDGDAIARLANSATWLNNAAVGLDTTYFDGEGEYVMGYPSGIASDRSFGGVGPGNVALTNVATTSESRLNITHGGGVIRIVGDEGRQIHIGSIRVMQPAVNCTNAIVMFDGCDLVYDDESTFQANRYRGLSASERAREVPRIQLKNTHLAPSIITNAWDDATTGAIVAGYALGEAAVEFLPGSVVTGRIVAAGRSYGAHGAFYQRGGSVTVLGNAGSTFSNGSFLGGNVTSGHNHGYYELSGGDMTVCGLFSIGYVERGCFVQTGGTFTLTNAVGSLTMPLMGIGTGNGYGGSLCVFGGTFNASAGRPEINDGYADNSRQFATVSAAGPTAYIDFGGEYNWVNNTATACTLFTMSAGGTIRMQGVHKNNANSTLIVNFNNGTFVPTQDGNSSAEDVFHTYRSDSRWPHGWTDHVIVYSGGMTVDTDGKNGVYTYRPIEGATGGGVSGVVSSPIANICGAPVVRIDGDGYGAVGVADFDSVSNIVRGVKILAPGVGYTYATAKLLYGREPLVSFDCTISENSNTGGFTKKGEGSFILYATNTWGGATTVAGGTLKAGCDWAVPPGSALVLSGGGVMDFNGKTGEVASVTYVAGGGSIANSALVKLPSSSSVTISVDELLAGEKVSFEGDVDLDELSITLTGDTAKLVESDRRYTLVEAEGSISGTVNVATERSLPNGWNFKVVRNQLVLAFSKGMMLIIR